MDDYRAMSPFADLAADLEQLSAVGRRRTLQPIAGMDFTSNDYLGLAASKRIGISNARAVQGCPHTTCA
jgi:8-amino-7-oxononanoate synthase